MSTHYLNAAFSAVIKPSATKFVLVALADYANELGESYPSTETMEHKTCQDRKTILASVARLIEMGVLEDTGERKGKTRQIPVYRIVMNALKSIAFDRENAVERSAYMMKKTVPKTERLNSTENGTVPKTEQYRFSDETVPFFPENTVKESQKRDTEPSVYNHQSEPSVSFSGNSQKTEQKSTNTKAPANADGESKKTKPRTDKAFLAECKQTPTFDLKGVPEPMVLEFIKYRRELKKPLQTSKGVQGIINALAELKSETSMRVAVDYTMENEWMKIVVPAAPAPVEPTAAMMQAASTKGIVNGAVKAQMDAMVEYHTRKQNKVLDWDRAFSIWIERGAQFVATRKPMASRAEVASSNAAKAYEKLFGEKLPEAHADCIEGELA